ncbi:MAG TPA: hypothetical protein VEY90_02735 [Thermoleophilaceae bacterium]|jgi:hypothetical protein|nr:hypothetical protein [Thermoleophilaceae bacterium]
MGRRSRKRGTQTTRAERDAARRERWLERTPAEPSDSARGARPARRAPRERPPAPWGGFPLSELVILLGIVLIVWGAVSGEDGAERLFAGLVIASLGGGELALREHLAGYRSHSALLAGVAAFVTVTVVALGLGPIRIWVLLVLGVAVFAGCFYAMRELFKRRSGGLSFR